MEPGSRAGQAVVISALVHAPWFYTHKCTHMRAHMDSAVGCDGVGWGAVRARVCRQQADINTSMQVHRNPARRGLWRTDQKDEFSAT